MEACLRGHYFTVQFLIKQNIDINEAADDGQTPLSVACLNGHLGVVQLLLVHSADLFCKLDDSSTMIIETARQGYVDVVRVLLDHIRSVMGNVKPRVSPDTPVKEPVDESSAPSQKKYEVYTYINI